MYVTNSLSVQQKLNILINYTPIKIQKKKKGE